MILGIYGATRADELTRMDLADVKIQGGVYVIKIPKTKTHIIRTFTIEGEYVLYVKKYLQIRSLITSTTRFFMNYQKGKCTRQPIGKNKFLTTPKVIAEFLKLPDATKYTGHSFRRTSATLLADGGGSMIQLKQLGGWKSNTTCEGYLEDSVMNKRKIGGLIAGQVGLPPTSESSRLTVTRRILPTSTITSSVAESYDTSVTCSQSVVRITHSSQAVVGSNEVLHVSEGAVLQGSTKPDEVGHMQFQNCKVDIHFHK